MPELDGALLYDAAWAPSPRRVRIFLAEKGVAVERVSIDLRSDEQLGDPYRAINPRGTVPALRLASGEVIVESTAICRYVEALFPEPSLFGRTPIAVARIDAWIHRIEAEGYAAAVYVFRNARPVFAGRGIPGAGPAVAQIPALVERGHAMWGGFTAALEARLAETRWIAGDAYSFADVSALVALDFARSARLPWGAGQPAIARWHAEASDRPSASA